MIYVGSRVLDPAHLFFFTLTECMNYIIAMLLMASCMNTHVNPPK